MLLIIKSGIPFLKTLLKYSWFTILCSLLLHSKVIQLCMYVFFFLFFPILVYCRILNVGPCAIQELVMDRQVWHAAVHGVTKSLTQLSNWTELCYTREPGCLSSYSLHLLIPNSQFFLSHPPFLLASTNLFSMSVRLFLTNRNTFEREKRYS